MISGYSRYCPTLIINSMSTDCCTQVGDKCWHSHCLRCSCCHTPLNCHSSCFLKYDQVLCKVDYIRLYGTKCSKCCHPITQSDWIRRAHDQVSGNIKTWFNELIKNHVMVWKSIHCIPPSTLTHLTAINLWKLYAQISNNPFSGISFSMFCLWLVCSPIIHWRGIWSGLWQGN